MRYFVKFDFFSSNISQFQTVRYIVQTAQVSKQAQVSTSMASASMVQFWSFLFKLWLPQCFGQKVPSCIWDIVLIHCIQPKIHSCSAQDDKERNQSESKFASMVLIIGIQKFLVAPLTRDPIFWKFVLGPEDLALGLFYQIE